MSRTSLVVIASILSVACNVESNSKPSSGVELHPALPATCDRGVVVVMSDYRSTNVAISNLDGTTVSESFVTSGSAKPGLAMALSGDVVVPSAAPASGRLVLLDRFGTNVITWLDLDSGAVLEQLPIGTGFESNPHDYLEYGDGKAAVSRFGSNPNAGRERFDPGGDLLLISTDKPAILGRIGMPEEDPGLLPRPSGMTLLGETAVVTLGRLSADFSTAGPGRFVGVSLEQERVVWTVDIPELTNCGQLAKSPSGRLGAIACSSQIDSTTYQYDPSKSDVVIFDLTVTPPKELRRLGLARSLDAGLQSTVVFATERALLAKTYGGNATPGDSLVTVDATTGEFEVLRKAEGAYVLGGMRCAPGCGDVCIVTDAESAKLRRFSVSPTGAFAELEPVTVDATIGLPPRDLGGL